MLKNDSTAISLFPMFNILVCTLGVLIFILGTVAAVSLGVDKSIVIGIKSYGGSKQIKEPIYFEWDGTTLTVQPSKKKVVFKKDIKEIDTYKATYQYMAQMLDETDLGSIIDAIKAQKMTQYAMILVRPSGFKSLKEVRGYFEYIGIDVGYEPVDQDWHIRIR